MFARENPRAETQPELHQALLRLSAIISEYFTGWLLYRWFRTVAVQICSVQAVRFLSGFALPAV
jgi:hypothetical protein